MPISQLKGEQELDALFSLLDQQLATKVIRGGMRAGAQVIAAEAKLRARNSAVAESVGVGSTRVRPDGIR